MSELPSKLTPEDAMTIAGLTRSIIDYPRKTEDVPLEGAITGEGVPDDFTILLGDIDRILGRYTVNVRVQVMNDLLPQLGINVARPSPVD